MNSNLRTTFHRDGTITYWDVYTQTWRRRVTADQIGSATLATMTDAERKRIARRRRVN